jgi:DNA excision repair protein ERCC-4
MLNPIQNVLILVDDRERPSGVADELEKLSGLAVRVEHLTVGDYDVDGAVLIERKTATDFAQSLIDGRLFRQAKHMSASPLRTAYILEGSVGDWLGLGVSREAIQGALVTLTLIFDIPVFRSSGPAESARLIFYIGSQLPACATPNMCLIGRGNRSERSAGSFACYKACLELARIVPTGCWSASRPCVRASAPRQPS